MGEAMDKLIAAVEAGDLTAHHRRHVWTVRCPRLAAGDAQGGEGRGGCGVNVTVGRSVGPA